MHKLIKTLKMVNDLAKGSMQRRIPSEYINGKVSQPTLDAYGDHMVGIKGSRDKLSTLGGNDRKRALAKLTAKTSTRLTPTGHTEFLLHRAHQSSENALANPNKTSWTPHYDEAAKLARTYGSGNVTSAWVGKHRIETIPSQFGNAVMDRGLQNKSGDTRHEVVVNVGPRLNLATGDERRAAIAYHRSKDSIASTPMESIHNHINKKASAKAGAWPFDNPQYEIKGRKRISKRNHHINVNYPKEQIDVKPLPKSEKILNDLKKGSMQRKMGHSKSSEVPALDSHKYREWQDFGTNRESVPGLPSQPDRARALHKLSGQTKTRLTPTGKKEFLLHRGYSAAEDPHTATKHASWTPDYSIAHGFAKKYKNNVASAWVHEDNIHSIPNQIGSFKGKTGPNEKRREKEVITVPGATHPPASNQEAAEARDLMSLRAHKRLNNHINAKSVLKQASTSKDALNHRVIQKIKSRAD